MYSLFYHFKYLFSYRKNIAIISQDPFLFTGTIRENIDPDNKYSDNKILTTINNLGLNEVVTDLETMVYDNGSSYSSGQKQLICLARAAIAKCKILVLDEPTANLDAETDEMLFQVVEELFDNCTILLIAHRVQQIKTCDKVLVLDSGEIVEFDDPKKLMKRKESLFYKMCQRATD